ncbi:VOC family protein [Kribbella sp. DT2]|uniref:VOC family protein n=1 Tax=Kribbella sp. DT2 TaxID=3393427 RepID=UPI003CF84F3F
MSENPEFDHLLHCVPDVAAAAEAYTAAGLPAHVNPPYLGFQNAGWRLDERYLEILTIVDADEFATSPFGVSTISWQPTVDRLIADGGGALNFAINVTDVTATQERLLEQGVPCQLHTFTREGSPVSFQELILLDAPSWAPFFITYTPERVTLVKQYAAHLVDRGEHDLVAFVIETPDPQEAARWLGELTGLTPYDVKLPLPGGEVWFEEGPADRLTALVLTGQPSTHEILGLELRHVS